METSSSSGVFHSSKTIKVVVLEQKNDVTKRSASPFGEGVGSREYAFAIEWKAPGEQQKEWWIKDKSISENKLILGLLRGGNGNHLSYDRPPSASKQRNGDP